MRADEKKKGGGPMERMTELYAMAGPEALGDVSADISAVERLTNELEAHETQEGRFLREYRDLAGKTENRMIKFLLQMIISDEEKHHAVTHAMVSTLKGDLNWTRPQEAIRGLYDLREEKGKFLKLTEDFIRVEKEGVKDYKKLMKEAKGYYRNLFVLLFQSMVHDSEKHVKILEFLRERLKEA
jgi:bacterioferritin (cytochrome b1)